MSACYLHKQLHGAPEIVVVEAASIPKIGVGEATVPNLQPVFFDALGLPESEWMRGCNAAFKGAVKFIGWRTGDIQGDGDRFYHPFGIVPNCDGLPLTHYWAMMRDGGSLGAVDYSCFKETNAPGRSAGTVHLGGRARDALRVALRRPVAGKLPETGRDRLGRSP